MPFSGKFQEKRNFPFGLVKAFEKRVLPVWRYLVHNLAMVDSSQPRTRATAATELWLYMVHNLAMVDSSQPRARATVATELWLCSNPMARPRSSVDYLGMFGCFEKFCYYTLMGRSSEIVIPQEILKFNQICTCSTQKDTFVPRDKFTRMRT